MIETDYEISVTENRPESGMWHNGPNHCWITVTHKPSGQCARAFGRNQHETHQRAKSVLHLLLMDWTGEKPQFVERVLNPTPKDK